MTMVSENVIGWQRDLPPINWRPLSWPRIEFKSPGPDGVVYGFLFRLVGAAVAVLVGSLLVVVTGAFNGWSLTPRLLCIEAGLVGILVLLTEHLRSRVYERLIAGDETKVLAIADIRPLPETPSLPLRPRHSSLQRFTDVVFAAALLVWLQRGASNLALSLAWQQHEWRRTHFL